MLLLTWALKYVLTYFAMVSGNTGDSVLFAETARARRRARSGLAARAPDGSLVGPPRPLPSPQCPLGDACGWNRLSRAQASSALHCPGPQLAEKMLKWQDPQEMTLGLVLREAARKAPSPPPPS